MLTIRKEQIHTLRAPKLKRFYQEVLVHVKRHFPEETDNKNDQELVEHIRQAGDRAAAYGLKAERDLYLFINISMLYGPCFDRQEKTAWTKDFLDDKDVSNSSQRVALLHAEVIRRLALSERMPEIQRRFYGADGQ